jgi:hypothetical protein
VLSLEQFVLCKIAEEATEVGKRALKQQQFGGLQHEEGYLRNRDRLTAECNDLRMWLTIGWELDQVGQTLDQNVRWRSKHSELLRVLRIAVAEGQVEPRALDYFENKTYL